MGGSPAPARASCRRPLAGPDEKGKSAPLRALVSTSCSKYVIKSRMTGDRLVRFCEHLRGEIPLRDCLIGDEVASLSAPPRSTAVWAAACQHWLLSKLSSTITLPMPPDTRHLRRVHRRQRQSRIGQGCLTASPGEGEPFLPGHSSKAFKRDGKAWILTGLGPCSLRRGL